MAKRSNGRRTGASTTREIAKLRDDVAQVAEIDAPEVPPMLETGYRGPLPDPEPPPPDDELPPDGEGTD